MHVSAITMLRLEHLKVVFWKWHEVNTLLIFFMETTDGLDIWSAISCWFCFFITKYKMYICTYSFYMPVTKPLNQQHLWSVRSRAMNAPQRQITAPNTHREMTFQALLQDSCWIPFFNQDGSGIYWLWNSQGVGRISIMNGCSVLQMYKATRALLKDWD